ncbi:MAG: type II toxin-antitoxin system RelE/ParE family toxin [Alphaproteobacteria bacterium]|nr:type II toxin-antitoxin system RelE/ParE family toxin [Alphaproteobacteria bacterium]
MTDVVFHPLAQQELLDAAQFYETYATGLGNDFIREVERMLGQIIAHPQAGNVLTGSIRRRLVRRFPFAILYQTRADALFVIALMHLRRRPGYWRRRVRDDT